MQHRVESFSDLIMGFSVALLGLTLTIPAHTVQLFREPAWISVYCWTFAIIVSVWILHQRLFAAYFDPKPVALGLNFLMLALLVLLCFFVQVFGHMHDPADRLLALLAYIVIFSLIFLIMAVLYAIGLRARWSLLTPEQRLRGVATAVRITCLLLGLAGGLVASRFDPESLTFAIGVLVGAVLGRAAMPMLRARIPALRATEPAAP
jgi:hypothetical protein